MPAAIVKLIIGIVLSRIHLGENDEKNKSKCLFVFLCVCEKDSQGKKDVVRLRLL